MSIISLEFAKLGFRFKAYLRYNSAQNWEINHLHNILGF